ncbi:hypothetical protein A7985_12580 [Pseudoalteromonas luteoviolacea]|uniref:Uncharacterized protein n=1 Tax=Pseudoalteromonas luteoviolacea TaxID=43657 RepID=A0A1C0TR54_9GAMM|nr:tetratricopeptide repeat protein [Pseudoalteromonas luteoviolacea]MBQ4813316.1 tetratricopeptide repeat protein [Pseudoalteromonas luteoviolacea]OCQ21442.1 hypothetical protein A7985_12580 [Pseudoalteromonas luteoviolacea]
MRYTITTLCLLFSTYNVAALEPQITTGYHAKKHSINIGDIFSFQENGAWQALKVLDTHTDEYNSTTVHVLIYKPSTTKPTLKSLRNQPILSYHAPLSHTLFTSDWQFVGHASPLSAELKPYINYLKHNDFKKYAAATDQKIDDLIFRANTQYTKGYALSQAAQYEQAIEAYKQAVNIFPLYYEAIDNIGFAYMDMGEFEKAIEYFDRSLGVYPEGATALYYKGMSYINLEDAANAIETFKQGIEAFPERKQAFEEMYNSLRGLTR